MGTPRRITVSLTKEQWEQVEVLAIFLKVKEDLVIERLALQNLQSILDDVWEVLVAKWQLPKGPAVADGDDLPF